MLSALAVVLPSHAVVGTTESSLALVLLEDTLQDAQFAQSNPSQSGPHLRYLPKARQNYIGGNEDSPGPTSPLQFYAPKSYFSKKCSSLAVLDVSFCDATSTVFAAAGSTVLTWDVIKAQRTAVSRPSAPDLAAACAWLSPHCAVSAGAACAVSFWDTRAGARAVHLAKVARDNLYALGAAENGIYAGGADGKVQFVDLRNEVHEELDFGRHGAVVGMDTEELAVVFEDGAVRMAANGAREASFCSGAVAAKSRVGCALLEGTVAVGSENGVVRLWRNGILGEIDVQLAVSCLEFWDDDLVGTAGECLWRWSQAGRGET